MTTALKIAQNLYCSGNYKESLEAYQEILKNPSSPEEEGIAHTMIACLYESCDCFAAPGRGDIVREHMKKACDLSCPLALLYSPSPVPVELTDREENELVDQVLILAKDGNTLAMQLMGSFMDEKISPEEGYEKARRWMEKAAGLGDPKAMINLGKLLQVKGFEGHDDELALSWYRKASERGLSYGTYEEGCCYLYGEGTARDISKGFALMEKAAEGGSDIACQELWHFYSGIKPVGPQFFDNSEKARKYLHLAYERGNDEAALDMALAILKSKTADKQVLQEVMGYLREAEDRGSVKATTMIGQLYYNGLMGKHREKGIPFLKKAAKFNEPTALALLGSALMNGRGIRKNVPRGMEYMEKAAEYGDSEGLAEMAWYFSDNNRLKEALEYARKAVEQDAPTGEAEYLLATMYFKGRGVERSNEEGRKYLKAAVEKGCPRAISLDREMRQKATMEGLKEDDFIFR